VQVMIDEAKEKIAASLAREAAGGQA
jgi:hypothetical protein